MANELDEVTAPVTSRSEEFHGTVEDAKATPKADTSKPNPALESLNKGIFF